MKNFKARGSKNGSQGQKAHGVARVISKRGFCSRSKAEALVRDGRVKLRGKCVTDPETPAYENDIISVDGVEVTANAHIYFMMNKPRGIVTTASDEKGRQTVMDIFAQQYRQMYPGKEIPHIAPVGRLDAASEGLLLLTNDTKWANEILDPTPSESTAATKAHFKIYRVQTKGKPTAEQLHKMEEGFNVAPRVFGESEEFMHAHSAKMHAEGEKNCWLEITLTEGKNREIRRMLEHLGYEVLRLVRIQIDAFLLNDLKPGCIKEIRP